ncbi:MAG TPA: hypothetical protein VIP54_11725 [Microterricola sp.]
MFVIFRLVVRRGQVTTLRQVQQAAGCEKVKGRVYLFFSGVLLDFRGVDRRSAVMEEMTE